MVEKLNSLFSRITPEQLKRLDQQVVDAVRQSLRTLVGKKINLGDYRLSFDLSGPDEEIQPDHVVSNHINPLG